MLYSIKREDPSRLSTVEVYLLVRAGTRIRREEHNEILRQALDLLALRRVRRAWSLSAASANSHRSK
jgi:hypothetical protein